MLMPMMNSALAEINDYYIRRLIVYQSDCKLDELIRVELKSSSEFHATCLNVSFYPDGLEILCSDNTDNSSCKVKTESKAFNSLELLRQDNERN